LIPFKYPGTVASSYCHQPCLYWKLRYRARIMYSGDQW